MKKVPTYIGYSILLLGGAVGIVLLFRMVLRLLFAAFAFLLLNTGPTSIVKSYELETQIEYYQTNHTKYVEQTIGSVFITTRMIGTDKTTLSEDPPYRFALVAYQVMREECAIEIVGADIKIGNEDPVDILNQLDATSMEFSESNISFDGESLDTKSATTGFVINEDPDQGRQILISVTVQAGDNQNTIEFVFQPVVKTRRQTPAI